MIVVYDRHGRIAYTVDDPYPPELLDLYAARAESEVDFNFHDEAPSPIDDRYVDVNQGAIAVRPDMPVAVEGLCLSGLPVGATVQIDGGAQVFEASADTLNLEAEDPGVYTVRLSKWPFKDFTAVIEVAA